MLALLLPLWDVDNNDSQLTVMGCLGLITFRSTLQPLVFLAAALGVLSPASEVAAGGNYNSRFLDAEERRSMSPASREVSIPNWGNHTLPRHAVIPYVPVSLYLQQAGFLWQDGAVWLPEQGIFGEEWQLDGENEAAADRRDITFHRVYFSDPIGRRHPWAFEQDLFTQGHDGHDDENYIRSHLRAGDYVHVRSRVTERYLGIDGESISHIDQEMNIVAIDGHDRLPVG